MEFFLRKFLNQFGEVTDSALQTLLECGEIRNYDKKTIVIHEGETEEYLNIIYKGLVRKFFMSNEEEVVTHLAAEGDLITASDSYLSGRPTQYYVETIEPTTFFSISHDQINRLYSLDKKWEFMGRMILTHFLTTLERWEIDQIKLSTKERFLKYKETNQELFDRVPQKFLASYLNIQPETFSRLKQSVKYPV
jgi:signal-transduction protein with cAMP-binding, CBS, and nucleotidyltransferase domain